MFEVRNHLFSRCVKRLFVLFVFFSSIVSDAYCWGARGHHIVGVQAANLVPVLLGDPDSPTSKFFKENALILGHLSNVPDKIWRSRSRFKRVASMNSPNHYWGPERILGEPPSDPKLFGIYLEQIKSLSADYDTLLEKFRLRTVGVNGVLSASKFYKSVGNLPWRVQQLFNFLVDSFSCAKAKEGKIWPDVSANTISEKAFKVAPDQGKAEKFDPPLPTYQCDPYVHPYSDFYAALVVAGIMSHFVGDNGQPLHPTADHDGWHTGNGGLHSYFESQVVRELDLALDSDVLKMASDSNFQTTNWTDVGVAKFDNSTVTTLMFRLGAQSLARKDLLLSIDDREAVTSSSRSLPYGDHPRNHSEKFSSAKRKSPSDPSVLKGFRSLIVERLAVSSFVLAKLWIEAWKRAGSPKLGGRAEIKLPHPQDPPFIWPDYDLKALGASRIN